MWVLLRPPQFGGAKHAYDHDNRSRYRQIGVPAPRHCCGLSRYVRDLVAHGRERVVSWPLVASSDAGNFFSAPESIFSAGALASALASGGTALGEFKGPGVTLSGGAFCCAGGAGVAASLLLP